MKNTESPQRLIEWLLAWAREPEDDRPNASSKGVVLILSVVSIGLLVLIFELS